MANKSVADIVNEILKAPAATLDETKNGLLVAAALYGYDGTDLRRLLTTTDGVLTIGTPQGSTALGDGRNDNDTHLHNAGGNVAVVPAKEFLFNSSTWDRARNNINATALASAARTASVNSADQVNYNSRGLHLVIDVTAITSTPSITITIQGKDNLSGQYYTILASAAITTVSTVVLRVGPGLTAAANLVANDLLPRTWRVSVTNGDADGITYSIGYSLIL